VKVLKQDRRGNAGGEGTIPAQGARLMLAEALASEVEECIARFADERDEHGHRLGAMVPASPVHLGDPAAVSTEDPEAALVEITDPEKVAAAYFLAITGDGQRVV
jgi:hypothetical protein